jgi:predicted nucleic acid-binding protein
VKPIIVLDTNILLDVLVFDDDRAHPLRAALDANQLDAIARILKCHWARAIFFK